MFSTADGEKVKIAVVHSDFLCGYASIGQMNFKCLKLCGLYQPRFYLVEFKNEVQH